MPDWIVWNEGGSDNGVYERGTLDEASEQAPDEPDVVAIAQALLSSPVLDQQTKDAIATAAGDQVVATLDTTPEQAPGK